MPTLPQSPARIVAPKLIRPEKGGQVGEWSYLLHAEGQDYIFPAHVRELGHLSSPNDEPGKEEPQEEKEGVVIRTADPLWATKVIYWKASEWETKLLPKAVEWMNSRHFTFPTVPFNRMEFRKIEDRDGEERVTEVVNVIALTEQQLGEDHPELLFYQFKEIDGQGGTGRRPLMQWWSEGFLYFRGAEIQGKGYSVQRACRGLANYWGKHPDFMRQLIEKEGKEHVFKLLCVDKGKGKEIDEEELRVAVMWVAFCRYIASLKTTYEAGLPFQGKRRSEARNTEEALALEQATIFKTVGVLKSGVRKKPVATGTGTKHRYRYLVRGHERIVNGKSIWVKPQIRGEGEFLNRAVGTEEATPAAKVIQPPASVSVMVPVKEPTTASPEQPRTEPRPRLVTRVLRFLFGVFRFTRRADAARNRPPEPPLAVNSARNR